MMFSRQKNFSFYIFMSDSECTEIAEVNEVVDQNKDENKRLI